MIIARFFGGSWHGERLVLPTREPWPRFVIPERHNLLILEFIYLLAGPGEYANEFNYLASTPD